MNFRKSSKKGGGSFSIQKFILQILDLKYGFFSMKMIQKGLFRVCFQPITTLNCCTTCISWEIGSYNTQKSRHNEHTHFCRNFVAILSRNPQYDFPTMGGEGFKCCLELFRKFIRFGVPICPLPTSPRTAVWRRIIRFKLFNGK